MYTPTGTQVASSPALLLIFHRSPLSNHCGGEKRVLWVWGSWALPSWKILPDAKRKYNRWYMENQWVHIPNGAKTLTPMCGISTHDPKMFNCIPILHVSNENKKNSAKNVVLCRANLARLLGDFSGVGSDSITWKTALGYLQIWYP